MGNLDFSFTNPSLVLTRFLVLLLWVVLGMLVRVLWHFKK